jgi:hypothetical protein
LQKFQSNFGASEINLKRKNCKVRNKNKHIYLNECKISAQNYIPLCFLNPEQSIAEFQEIKVVKMAVLTPLKRKTVFIASSKTSVSLMYTDLQMGQANSMV